MNRKLKEMMSRTILLMIVMILSLFSTISAENRALLVGIGTYDTLKTGWSAIIGDNDVDMHTEHGIALNRQIAFVLFQKMIKFALY